MTRSTFTLCCLLAIPACKKSADPKPADTKVTESAAPEAKPAAPSSDGKCADGFTYNTTGKFCIKLPAKVSSKPDPAGNPSGNGTATQYGWSGGDSGSDFGITVMVSAFNQEYWADSLERVKQPPYEGKLVADGKLDSGGTWALGDESAPPAGKHPRRWIHTVAKSDKLRLTCEITRATGAGSPNEDEVFEACKSIVFARS